MAGKIFTRNQNASYKGIESGKDRLNNCELPNGLVVFNESIYLHSMSKRSTTMHNVLFCVHTLCMNNVTITLLLVSSPVRSKQLLCFVQGQGQKSEKKYSTKSFDEFHNHSSLAADSCTSCSLYGKSFEIEILRN